MASRRIFFRQTVTGGLALLGAVLLATPGSAAASDLGSFESRIGRSATDDFTRPKATCVCLDDNQLHGIAGLLLRRSAFVDFGNGVQETIRIDCSVLGFDTPGDLVVAGDCQTFVPLPR
jgi:hypothetical protein